MASAFSGDDLNFLQHLFKFLLFIEGTNLFHNWYGYLKVERVKLHQWQHRQLSSTNFFSSPWSSCVAKSIIQLSSYLLAVAENLTEMWNSTNEQKFYPHFQRKKRQMYHIHKIYQLESHTLSKMKDLHDELHSKVA